MTRAQSVGALTTEIPGQQLTEALAAFARETGLQLVYVSRVTQGKASPGAPAGLSPSAALSRLLEGSGLQFEFLNERTVRIFAQRAPGEGASKLPPALGLSAAAAEKLDEVVVSAFARQETVDRVPITVSVWTAEQIEAAGITRLDDLAQQTAGAYFMQASRTGPGFDTAWVLRGLNGLPGNATVGVYIDDVPLHQHNSLGVFGDTRPLTFDVDRVEVLYGPQGMLGGDSAEAGAVHLVSRQPSLTDWSGSLSGTIAATEHGAPSYEAGVAAGGPIAPGSAGFRVSVWARNDGGYVDRVDPFTGAVVDGNANHTSSSSVRLALAFAPAESVLVTPSFIRQSVDLHDSPAFYEYLSNPAAGAFLNGKLAQQPYEDTLNLGSISATVSFPGSQLTSVTAYAHRAMYAVSDTTNNIGLEFGGWGNPLGNSYPASYLDAVPTTLNDTQSQLSEEIRLSSSDPHAPLRWLWGVWLSHTVEDETTLISPVDPSLASTFAGFSWVSVATTETDMFGQVDVRIADGLRVAAGARVSHGDLAVSAVQLGPLNAGAPPGFQGESRQTNVAPRFDLTYTPEDYGVLYLSVAKGYRVGGVNLPQISGCNEPVAPTYRGDSMWSYEAGAKARSPGGSLQVDAAVFHLVFRDILQYAYTSCGQNYLTNAGTAASDGFDLSLHYDAFSRMQLGAAVEYANARYTEDVSLPGVGYSLSQGDALGIAPHVAPPWSGTAWINAIVAPTRHPLVSVRLDAAFRSHHPGPFYTDNPADGSYAPGWRSDPATTLVNLRAQLSWSSFEITAFVNNVFDAHPLLSHMTDAPNPRATLYYDMTFRPRTSGVAMSVRF